MNILLLNDAYFLQSLRRLGHSVFCAGMAGEADWRLPDAPVFLQEILKACPFQPDFVLFSDSINLRPAFLGLEKAELPLVFFGVDAPMNSFWQSDFCRAFDLAFLDQNQCVDDLRAAYPQDAERFHWLPLGADHRVYCHYPIEKTYDVTFVGSLHPRLRPKRVWMLEELRRHFDVKIFNGQNQRSLTPAQVVQIYNQSRLVINENLFPGLNLRLFEVMSCGACLLTEESDGSWKRFFGDGVHLAVFNSNNLVKRAASLLRDAARRERIAEQGMKIVREKHTIDQRAQALVETVSAFLSKQGSAKLDRRPNFCLSKAFLSLAQRWPQQPVGALKDEGMRLLRSEVALGLESADLHFELAAQALSEGRAQDALASLRRAQELDPEHLRSIWTLFWCFREIGEHYEALLEIVQLRRCLRVPPPHRAFHETIVSGSELSAQEYLDLGEILEKAGWLFEPGIERSEGHPCRWNAYDAYQKALALNPALCEPYLKCADLLERSTCPEFALLFIEKAVALRSFDAALRLRYARLLLISYRRQEGCEQLMQFLFLSTASDKWNQVEALRLSAAEWNYLICHVQDFSAKTDPAQLPCGET